MLELKNINLSLGSFSLSEINLKLDKGDYFVIVGPSGAGKSIILELIAGIQIPKSGKVILGGKDITKNRIQDRSVGLVFQDFAIFPHLNVEQNIAYPLKVKKWSKEKTQQRVEELAKQMDIFHLLNRRTTRLSGGELQRVALARTLALSPDLLLLDEPLASLDVQLKKDLRSQLRKLHKKGQTIIHVTHDYEEALLLADKVAIFKNGKIVQQGLKSNVFDEPKSEFVANFIGINNYFEVTKLEKEFVELEGKLSLKCENPVESTETLKAIMIHSDDIKLCKTCVESEKKANTFSGVVNDIYYAHQGFEIHIDIGLPLVVNISKQELAVLNIKEGDCLDCIIPLEKIHRINAE